MTINTIGQRFCWTEISWINNNRKHKVRLSQEANIILFTNRLRQNNIQFTTELKTLVLNDDEVLEIEI